MAATFWCTSCGGQQETEVRNTLQQIEVRGEAISVEGRVRFCRACGAEIADRQLDELMLRTAYDVYRRRHQLLTSADIAALRERYGLSQRALSQLLGWGQITIHRYESGALQSEAHNQVLKTLDNPERVKEILDQHPGRLSPQFEQQLRQRVQRLLDASVDERLAREIRRVLEDQAPSAITGYRQFDFERLSQMVLFFLSRVDLVFKTKLMKLLWYADFAHFMQHSVGISGAAYAHLPHGPALNHWDAILAALTERDVVAIRTVFGPTWEGEQLVAKAEVDLRGFSADERATLEFIATTLGDKSATALSDLSHTELGYRLTSNAELISYEHALTLSLDLGGRPS